MTVGETLPALSKITKCLPESPIRSYDARIPAAVKRVSEYQQAYKGWPWQPVRQNYKPEPPKKTNDKPMQKRTSYGVDYASHPIQRQATVKKNKGSLSISKKPLEKHTTYNMEFYSKQLPEFSMDTDALWAVKKMPQEVEPLTFEGESIYTLSYPAYEPQTIYDAKPAIITAKDNLAIPAAAGDIVINPKTTVQVDFVPYQNHDPPEPIRPRGNTYPCGEPMAFKEPIRPKDNAISTSEPIPKEPPISPKGNSDTTSEPIAKDTKCKATSIDPLKHIHLAKIQKLVEINPDFEAISTAMADFTAPSKPQRRNPKIPADNIQRNIAPFNDDTTFKMTYKEWPVMPPEHPTWAKKPVYKRRSGGFVTKSLYAKDFCNPHVVDRDLELRPVTRDVNIITNKPGNRPFNYITTYDNDYKITEGAKAPESYFVVEKYRPPVMPMAKETVQMSDYKVHQVGLTLPIRHSSQHRELYDTADMTFDTTYNENFRGYRPKSCPSKITSSTVQNSPKRSKVTPIPIPDLSMLPRINAYPIITPTVTPVPSHTRKLDKGPKTPRNSPEM